jgi:hypothetical protein
MYCPHTAIYVSSYCYVCVLIQRLFSPPFWLAMYLSILWNIKYVCVYTCDTCIAVWGHIYSSMRTHVAVIGQISNMCACTHLVPNETCAWYLYIRCHKQTCVRGMGRWTSASNLLLYICSSIYVSSYYYICVLILLYMCPHTTIYVSSYYYICMKIHQRRIYYYICVLILLYMCRYYISSALVLLYMCPHTTIYTQISLLYI